MRLNRLVAPALVLTLYALLMFLLPSPPWPEVRPYGGALLFDGQRTYADLETLARQYPSRAHGTTAYDAAAAWVAGRFEEMGLDALVEGFSGPKLPGEDAPPPQGLGARLVRPLLDRQTWASASNVTAVVAGETSEAVVVFAHLDSAWSPGADDNASGVAVVLELARVLSPSPRPFTYAFVAVGGEEEGLWGSRAWVRQHIQRSGGRAALSVDGKTYGPVRLAVGLDCVAYAEGVLPQIGSLSTGNKKSDLGTLAALSAVLEDDRPGWLAGRTSFKTQVLGGPGSMGSDHVSFIEADVSAVCFGRAAKDGALSPYLNTKDDVLDHVSSDTLADAGQLAERFLRTVESVPPASWASDSTYVLSRRGFMPGWAITSAALLLVILLGAGGAPALAGWFGSRSSRDGYPAARQAELARSRAEARWYGLVAGWTVLLALALDLAYVPGLPFIAVGIPWLVLAVASLPILAWLRLRRFWPRAERTNDYLCLALAVWSLAGLALLGAAPLIYFLFWPAVILARLRGHSTELKALFRVVLIVWAGGWVLGALGRLGSFSALLGADYAMREIAMRWWFLGIGCLLFPAVWQATAREHGAAAVLVPRRATAAQVRAALALAPGLGRISRIYSGPDPRAMEAARVLGAALSPAGECAVLEGLREVGDRPEFSQADLDEMLAAPETAAPGGETAAEALERVRSALAEVAANLESRVGTAGGTAAADEAGHDTPLVILPEGLATLQAVAAATARRRAARETGQPERRAGQARPLWADEAWSAEARRHMRRAATSALSVVVADLATGFKLKELRPRRQTGEPSTT